MCSPSRVDGVSREVFELQRDNETEFGQSFSADSKPSMAFIKKKQKSIDTKAEKWLKRPFTNPARTDGLNLHHWDKESTSATRDYYFAKFNEKIPVLPCPSPAELTPLIAGECATVMNEQIAHEDAHGTDKCREYGGGVDV